MGQNQCGGTSSSSSSSSLSFEKDKLLKNSDDFEAFLRESKRYKIAMGLYEFQLGKIPSDAEYKLVISLYSSLSEEERRRSDRLQGKPPGPPKELKSFFKK